MKMYKIVYAYKERNRATLYVGPSCGPWAAQNHGLGHEFEMPELEDVLG
jgi:hypothetical protein